MQYNHNNACTLYVYVVVMSAHVCMSGLFRLISMFICIDIYFMLFVSISIMRIPINVVLYLHDHLLLLFIPFLWACAHTHSPLHGS